MPADIGRYTAGVNLANASGAYDAQNLGRDITQFRDQYDDAMYDIRAARKRRAIGTAAGIAVGLGTLGLGAALAPAVAGAAAAGGAAAGGAAAGGAAAGGAAAGGTFLGLGPASLRALAPILGRLAASAVGEENPAVSGGIDAITGIVNRRRFNVEEPKPTRPRRSGPQDVLGMMGY